MSAKQPDWVRNKNKGGRPRKWDWAGIAVGESLIIPVDAQTCSYGSFRVMASFNARKLGYKFHCRVRPDDKAFEAWRES